MAKPETEMSRSGFWRQEVFARARRLENALSPDEAAAATTPDKAAAATRVKCLIEVAHEAAVCRIGPFTWWNGTLEERAWLALHDAEVALLRAMENNDAINWWQCATGRIRPQVGAPPGALVEPGLPQVGAPPGALVAPGLPQDAGQAADSLRCYYDWSDRLFQETRALRNRLICLTAVGVVTTTLLLFAGVVGWLRIMSGRAAIVSGTEQFLQVALFGAIGAFITGLPVLSAAVRSLPQYTTSLYQLALKLATGPVFALVGVLTIASSFIVNVTPFRHFSGTVLLWAVIFGGTQQLLTGLLDRKAAVLTVEHEARWSGTGT